MVNLKLQTSHFILNSRFSHFPFSILHFQTQLTAISQIVVGNQLGGIRKYKWNFQDISCMRAAQIATHTHM